MRRRRLLFDADEGDAWCVGRRAWIEFIVRNLICHSRESGKTNKG